MVTPLDVDKFEELLIQTNYDKDETQFLVQGFREGFDIGYEGTTIRQSVSENIPFTVGDEIEMWNKIMKEVKANRVAGPFETIPFENYIQSPIGLVPKSGNKTRLIFHLSYQFSEKPDGISLNQATPRHKCTVKYNDLDVAIENCLKASKWAMRKNGNPVIYLGCTDFANAFRVLPLSKSSYCWLIFKAKDPKDGKIKYFVDKCLPFGASISCALYQRFSNAIKHITQVKSGNKIITNYLDDFLFIAIRRLICNQDMQTLLDIYELIKLPIALEKIEWGTTCLVFLGILLNGERLCISIPLEKKDKAIKLLNEFTNKKKATIKQLQVLTGYLNFLSKAIVPGRTFTRRMYAKYANWCVNKKGGYLKHYHHVSLDKEFKFDCEIWRMFLEHHSSASVCRPMIDLHVFETSEQLNFASDASANSKLGFGAVYGYKWLFAQWEPQFIKLNSPSIEYLELVGLVAAVLTWGESLKNRRIVVFTDNMSVVGMVNAMSSSCKNCMYLLRLLTLNNLIHNRRVFAKFVRGIDNDLPDALSRLQFDRFWRLAPPGMEKTPSQISPLIWPISAIWQK